MAHEECSWQLLNATGTDWQGGEMHTDTRIPDFKSKYLELAHLCITHGDH